jgi:branched-chain amino acid aminotransferase
MRNVAADGASAEADNRNTSEGGADLVVYIDGDYVPSGKAAVSVFDHGLLYGDGVFDTICAWNGYLFRLHDHVDRLLRSAHATRLQLRLTRDELIAAVKDTVKRNRLSNAYVKIVVTRGVSPEPLLDPRECQSSTIIFARPFLWLVSPEKVNSGIRAKIVSTRRIPAQCLDPKVKSLNYQNNAMAKIEAIEAGADEAIMLDVEGYVSEGPTYNLFTINGPLLRTPQDGVLLGITRAAVIELALREGWSTQMGRITPYDLYTADEVFFCSTAGGIAPIVEVDGRRVGTGRPGEKTMKLTQSYFDMLERGEGGAPIYE